MLNSGRPVDIRPVCTPALLIGFSDTSLRYFHGWPYLKHPCHLPKARKSQHLALPCALLRVSFKDRSLLLTVPDILSWVAPYTKSYARLLRVEQNWRGRTILSQVLGKHRNCWVPPRSQSHKCWWKSPKPIALKQEPRVLPGSQVIQPNGALRLPLESNLTSHCSFLPLS